MNEQLVTEETSSEDSEEERGGDDLEGGIRFTNERTIEDTKCSERAEESKLAIESAAWRYKKEDDLIEEKARNNLCDDHEVVSIYKTRFCKTCFISRPPLASHCRYCD
jgi:hypothetical protein